MILAVSSGSWLNSLGQLVSVLVLFVVVLFITWLTTRWIAGYQKSQMHNQNLRIIETLRLTNNNYIQIIEAGDVYLVIAVSKDHVEKLTEITKEQLKNDSKNDSFDMTGQKIDMAESFHDILDKMKKHLPKK